MPRLNTSCIAALVHILDSEFDPTARRRRSEVVDALEATLTASGIPARCLNDLLTAPGWQEASDMLRRLLEVANRAAAQRGEEAADAPPAPAPAAEVAEPALPLPEVQETASDFPAPEAPHLLSRELVGGWSIIERGKAWEIEARGYNYGLKKIEGSLKSGAFEVRITGQAGSVALVKRGDYRDCVRRAEEEYARVNGLAA